MKPKLNLNKIAKALGAKRRGKVTSRGGYFGAMQLLADTESQFRAHQPQSPRPVEPKPSSTTPANLQRS